MEPTLIALTAGDVAEALRDFAAKRENLSPEVVAASVVKVAWNVNGPTPIAAVVFLPRGPAK